MQKHICVIIATVLSLIQFSNANTSSVNDTLIQFIFFSSKNNSTVLKFLEACAQEVTEPCLRKLFFEEKSLGIVSDQRCCNLPFSHIFAVFNNGKIVTSLCIGAV